MEYPDILDTDFTSGGSNNRQMQDVIDYAIQEYEMQNEERERMTRLYNAHNGIISNPKEIEAIEKSTGRRSKTKYIKYRLGRSKLKLVQNEFLQLNIGANVFTVNREAQSKKMDRYKRQLGMAMAEPYINKARSMGYDVYSGVNIPKMEDENIWKADSLITKNEIIMQKIIDDKIANQSLKNLYHSNFVDMTLVSEMFAKIEKNPQGVDTLRYINPLNAIYLESLYDPLLERTPFFGEKRKMYLHEMLMDPDINLTEQQISELKRYVNNPGDAPSDMYTKNGNRLAFNVYIIQWIAVESRYKKVIKSKNSDIPYIKYISPEYYKEHSKSIEKEIKSGKYTVEKAYRGKIYQSCRIGTNMYTPAKQVVNTIQIKDEEGKYKPQFDYCGYLFNSINGSRISLQEIITELEKVYDDVMFQINKELKRIKGSVFVYDEAFLPRGKKVIDIIQSIDEDGVIRINSSAEGNEGNIDSIAQNLVKAFDLGGSKALANLMNQAMNIERTMERITGINDDRMGLTRPTSTATTNLNNLEASRTMTYDLFYFMGDYIKRTLLKLAAKTKLNYAHLKEDQRTFILSDDDIKFLEVTKDISYDDFGITITDGKKEAEVLAKIENYFPQEINAGLLTSKDVAKFYMESSFARAIKVLDEAHATMRAYNMQMQERQLKSKEAIESQRYKLATEDREDRQQHDKDLVILEAEAKKELESLKGGIKGMHNVQKMENDSLNNEESAENINAEIPELGTF